MPVQEMAVSPVKSLYWEQFPPMSQRRVYCTPVYHEGLLYVLGGCSETGMPLDSVEVLDVESQTWSQLPPLPTARAGASAVALGGQVMVLGGMNQQQTPLASVEMYHPDEGKWETKASLGQPSMGVTTVEKGRNPLQEKQKCKFSIDDRMTAFIDQSTTQPRDSSGSGSSPQQSALPGKPGAPLRLSLEAQRDDDYRGKPTQTSCLPDGVKSDDIKW